MFSAARSLLSRLVAATMVILLIGSLPAEAHEGGGTVRATDSTAEPRERDDTVTAASAAPDVFVEVDDPTGVGAGTPIEAHHPSATDRFSLATGCFTLSPRSTSGFLTSENGGYRADATSDAATPFHFQAIDLGRYLLYGSDSMFLSAEGGVTEQIEQLIDETFGPLPVRPGTELLKSIQDDFPSLVLPQVDLPATRTGGVVPVPVANAAGEWIVRDAEGGGFLIGLTADDREPENPGPSDAEATLPIEATLRADEDGTLRVVEGYDTSAVFDAVPADSGSCAEWPEVDLNISGLPSGPTERTDEVTGYIDGHLHMMAFEFLGGRARCGRPWHPYGVQFAMVDCPDHGTNGETALLEIALSGAPSHETAGWPTFPYWPKYDSLTHEQVYYRWMERAWRGGLSMFTNLLVDNNSLCEVWPMKKNSCNEMDAVRLQAQRLRELERYVDAQWGGPGKGWFRIVTGPHEARRVQNEGRLAVVMGIEVSVLFDCGLLAGQPTCDKADIDRQLAEVSDLGVRQLEFANKFDNALTGVTGDGGTTGVLTNFGNFLDTGQFIQMERCPLPGPDHDKRQHDKTQMNLPDESGGETGPLTERDAIFGAVLEVMGTSGVAPVYPEGPHCNSRGLSDLGEYLLDRMVERGLIFDPDHMSSLGRQAALKHLTSKGYTGVISSHSWADDTVYEWVLKMGGIVTPYAGSSESFAGNYRSTRSWADPRYLFGIGYGADTNGFGAQGGPRNPPSGEGVSYPFEGFDGVTVERQVSGQRVYDVNTDGVDHYGLYPDWIEDLRVQLGGESDQFMVDMANGPEAYLQMWERALGIENDACRDDRVDGPTLEEVAALGDGKPADEVLAALGQPHARRNGTYEYCLSAASTGDPVPFDDGGGAPGAPSPNGPSTLPKTGGSSPAPWLAGVVLLAALFVRRGSRKPAVRQR